MVSAYYLYGYFAAGFFPKTYAMLWLALTAVSPVLAWLCWYAKGSGPLALVLSAGIVGVFLDITFSWGLFYLSLRSWLDALLLLLTILVLGQRGRELAGMLVGGAVFAVLLDLLLPVSLW